MWLSPPLLSRQDLYYLGESIHLEIEKDMAFLFRKIMNLGRHGLEELLLVAGNIFRKFYVLGCLAPPVGRYFVLKASHLALAFLLLPKREKCQQKDIAS